MTKEIAASRSIRQWRHSGRRARNRCNQRAPCSDTLSSVERKEVVLALYNGSDLPQTGLSTTEACHNHTRLQMSTLAKGAADNLAPLEMVICISVTQEQIFLSCAIKKKKKPSGDYFGDI